LKNMGCGAMKLILDIDHVVREMNISSEVYARWKAASLDSSLDGGGARWKALEDSGFMERSYSKSHDLKIG
jgi:hypothetical protein